MIVTNSNQVKWGGRGYLDPRLQPVANLAALPTDTLEVFKGMSVVVLDDGSGVPHDYMWDGRQWVKKDNGGSSEEIQEVIDSIGSGFTSANTVADAISAIQGKLDGIEEGAEKNVNADWNAQEGTDAFIANKPDLSGYITKDADDLTNYYKKTETYTKDEVDEAVSGAVTGVATEEWVNQQGFIKEHQSLDDYATKDYVASAVTDMATQQWVNEQGFLKEHQSLDNYATKQDVQDATDGLATKDELTASTVGLVTSAELETAISDAMDDVPSAQEFDDMGNALTAMSETIAAKQDAFEPGAGLSLTNGTLNVLVDGTTIKVDEQTNKLHVIGGGGGTVSYIPGDYIDINNDVISVTGITPDEYATKAQLEGVATEDWVNNQGFLKEHQSLDEYATKADVEAEVTALTEAISTISDSLDNDFAKKTDIEDFATKDDVAQAVTASTEGFATEDWVNNQGFLKEHQSLDDYATKDDVAREVTALTEAIEAVAESVENDYAKKTDIEDFATKDDVAQAVTASTEGFATEEWVNNQGFLKEHQSLDNYVTDDKLEEALTALTETIDGEFASKDDLTAATEGFATEQWVNEQGFLKEHQSLDDYASKEYVGEAIADGLTAYTAENDFVTSDEVSEAIVAAVADKQDTLTPGDNISIENNVISVTGLDEFAKVADVENYVSTAVTEYVTEQGFIKGSDAETIITEKVTEYVDAQGYVTANDVDAVVSTAVTAFADEKGYIDEEEASALISTAVTEYVDAQGYVTGAEVEGLVSTAVTSYVDSQGYVKDSEVAEAIADAIEGKQDKLVEGDNISIENNVISAYGFVTPGELTSATYGLASEEWVNEQGFLKEHQSLDNYATRNDLEDAVTAITTSIENDYASKEWIANEGYLKSDALDDYVTDDEVADAITAATENLVTTDALDNYATKASVDAFYDEYRAQVSAMTEDFATEEWVNNQGFLKEHQSLDNYPTNDDVANAIELATGGLATKDELTASTTGFATEEWVNNQGFLKEHQSLDDYATRDEVEDALTALTETIADDYVEKSALDTLATKDELTASTAGFATEEWVNNQGFLKEHQSLDGYATRDELEGALTALTETIADEYIEKSELDTLATKDELTASTVGFATEEWVNNQGFLKEHQSLDDYVTEDKLEGALTALTETIADDYVEKSALDTLATKDELTASTVGFATEEWVNNQGFLKEHQSLENYATLDDLTSSSTQSVNAAIAGSTAWTENQGFAYEQDVRDTIADVLEIISTASTAANSYADSVGSTALTSAKSYTDSAVNDAITGITHPEYSIVTATPASNIYSATYQLTKDGNAVSGAAPINIPKSSNGKLENELVTDIALGHVSAGTVFSAGTSFEAILRQILTSGGGGGGGDTLYIYYGGLENPIDETTGMTEANITSNLTRSASAAAPGNITFRVNTGAWQLVVACPSTLILDEMIDTGNNIDYTQGVTDNYDPLGTTTINGATYNLYYHTFDTAFPQRVTFRITFVDA